MEVLYDENSFLNIIFKCYKDCLENDNKTPDLYVLTDNILEYVTDYCIHNVSYMGIRMSSIQAIDKILEDVLKKEGILYSKNGQIINTYQLIMFDDIE